MNSKMTKPVLAEFLGTFTLVFVGACAVVMAGQFGVMLPAFAHGFAVLGGAFMFGAISGAHFNPAVTFAMLITRNIDLMKAIFYWLAQFAGAILAGLLVGYLTGGFGETLGSIDPNTDFVKVVIFEAIMTFFLVSAIFQTAVHGRAGNLAPIVIGLTLTMAIMAGGAFTGAGLNPARTFGSALAAGNLSYLAPYFVGPALGAAVAALLHTYFLGDK